MVLLYLIQVTLDCAADAAWLLTLRGFAAQVATLDKRSLSQRRDAQANRLAQNGQAGNSSAGNRQQKPAGSDTCPVPSAYTGVDMAETINNLSVITIVISGLVLLIGVYFVKRGNRDAHMKAMLTASALATLFLVLYLTRLGLGFEKKYLGPNKGAYLALLISHIILAAANLPLALLALWNGWKGYQAAGRNLAHIDAPAARPFFARHRAWVRWTVPVWLYVAGTGWIIYLLLHKYGEVIPGH